MDVPFSKRMRKDTREVHGISDAMINAKLALSKSYKVRAHNGQQRIQSSLCLSALSDNTVWAEGLLVFYEVFKYLENNVPESLLPREIHRQAAFEADLDFYLTPEWRKDYAPREAVQQYIEHLETVRATNPDLLFAYVYHLYMGLLSGGQILQKKRDLAGRWGKVDESSEGRMVTTYPAGQPIAEMKTRMRSLVDSLAENWDEDFKGEFLRECRFVFELNNRIVATIKSADKVGRKRLAFILGLVIITWMLIRASQQQASS